MQVKNLSIHNKSGLFARPATFFVQKANEFKSNVYVEKDDRRVNAKSLLGILSLGLMDESLIKLIADGPDEVQAICDMEALLDQLAEGL